MTHEQQALSGIYQTEAPGVPVDTEGGWHPTLPKPILPAGMEIITVPEAEEWLRGVVEQNHWPTLYDTARFLPIIWGMYLREIIEKRDQKTHMLKEIAALREEAARRYSDLGLPEESESDTVLFNPNKEDGMAACPCGANPTTAEEVIRHANECTVLNGEENVNGN